MSDDSHDIPLRFMEHQVAINGLVHLFQVIILLAFMLVGFMAVLHTALLWRNHAILRERIELLENTSCFE